MNRIISFLLIFGFLYSEDFICDANSKEFYCNDEFQNMKLVDKIAQMIMVRVDGEFYNNENWRKKNVIRLIKNKKIFY